MILGVSPGKIDLCVVFHRRAVDLLRDNGCYGMLATSNIAEGSAISVGLGVVVKSGEIFFAKKGMPWPGTAAVVVAIVGFIKGHWQGECDADGSKCIRIGPRLEAESADNWVPQVLPDAPFTFAGTDNSKGLAFVITPCSSWFAPLRDERDSLLRPYITGDDITSSALNHIGRWALDIGDRDLDEISRRWPLAHHFLVEEVQPTRTDDALKSYKGLINRWWQFWNHRVNLMTRIRQHEKFIAYSKVTKHPICMLANSSWIYTNQVLLIALERDDMFAVCLSTFFRTWLEHFCGGGMGVTLRISISESVAKYPLPAVKVSQAGISAATRFNELAVEFSANQNCGLTDVMNAVNSPGNCIPVIVELRQLLIAIDIEVAAAYAWSDTNIVYDFQKFAGGSVNDPWRWALSEVTTVKILDSLIILNRQRFEEKFDAGLNGKSIARAKHALKGSKIKKSPPSQSLQTTLFDKSVETCLSSLLKKSRKGNAWGENATDQILAWLESQKGWFPKSAILNGCGANPDDCNSAINELLEDNFIESRNDDNEIRYRAKE